MKHFAVIYTMVDVAANADARPAHVEHLRSLLRAGRIIDGYKFPDYANGAVQGLLICSGESKEEVAALFAEDPAIMSGARTIEVRDSERMAIQA